MSVGPVLEYQSKPPRWKRWLTVLLNVGHVTLTHLVAVGVTCALLIGLPLVFCLLIFVCTLLLISTAKPGDDVGSPGLLVGAGLVALALGAGSALALCLVGIGTDLLRRAVRWPIWTSPLAVFGLTFLASLALGLTHHEAPRAAAGGSASLALLAFAFFCVYLLPLAFADTVLRVLRWLTARVYAAFQHRRGRRTLIPSAPAPPKTSAPPAGRDGTLLP